MNRCHRSKFSLLQNYLLSLRLLSALELSFQVQCVGVVFARHLVFRKEAEERKQEEIEETQEEEQSQRVGEWVWAGGEEG